MKKLSLVLVAIAVLCIPTKAQTISATGSLATVAATLTPGQWGEVTGMTNLYPTAVAGPNSWGASILNSDQVEAADDSSLQFGDKWMWNPQTHEAFVIGGSHSSTCTSNIPADCQILFNKFNADTGAWTRLALPTPTCVAYLNNSGTHMYEVMTIDPVNQNVYALFFTFCGMSEFRVWQYHIPNSTWTVLPHAFVLDAFNFSQVDALEYLPAINRLVFATAEVDDSNHAATVMVMWDPGTNVWTNFNLQQNTSPPFPGTQGYLLHAGWELNVAHYDPIHQILYSGGGAASKSDGPPPSIFDGPNQLWAVQVCGYTTSSGSCDKTTAQVPPYQLTTLTIPTTGAPGGICTQCGITVNDPVTGDILQFDAPYSSGTTCQTGPTALVLYRYHYGDSSWTNSNIGPGSGQSILCQNGNANYPMFQLLATPTDEQLGVILFLQQIDKTTVHLYVYKYAQRPSFTSKCSATGVLNCWNFNSPTDIDLNHQALRYQWDGNNNNLNNDPILMGQTNYPYTNNRNAGEANAQAYNMFATPQICTGGTPGTCNDIPVVDTSVKWEGAGSLALPIRQYNIEETGVYSDGLDGKLGHPNVAICKNDLTHCPQGDVLWMQYRVMFTPSLINNYIDQCQPLIPGTCYNAGDFQAHAVNSGGGTTSDKTFDCSGCLNSGDWTQGLCVGANNPSGCFATQSGKSLFMYSGNSCIPGIYTMVTVVAYNQAILDRSPSPVGQQCNSAVFLGQGVGAAAQPWKLSLVVSNALPFPAQPNCECIGEVFTRGNQSFLSALNVYDDKGNNQPGVPQQNYLFQPWTWYEVTKQIIVGDINVPNTEVKWWINGQLAYDWPFGKLDMDGGSDASHGYGLGQIQLELYTTKRDTFWDSGADGNAWIDNVVTSTSPIAFDSLAGGNVVPCTSPTKVVFTSQPSNAQLGASLGTVVAQIQDVSGALCTSATNTVTLSKDGAATWGILVSGSSLSKNASGGIATWTDLSVTSTAGSGSIDASSAGLTTAVSNSINITNSTCSSPSKLVITSQPSASAQLGASLGTITAQIQDSSNILCNTATNSVTVSKHAGATWGTLASSSSLTHSAVAGVVSWSDLSVITTTGSGAIDIASSGLTGATTNSINITAVVPGGGGNLRRRPLDELRY